MKYRRQKKRSVINEEEIIRDLKKMTAIKVSKIHNVSYNKVLQIKKNNNITHKEERNKAIMDLYEKGATYDEITKCCNVSSGTVNNVRRQYYYEYRLNHLEENQS